MLQAPITKSSQKDRLSNFEIIFHCRLVYKAFIVQLTSNYGFISFVKCLTLRSSIFTGKHFQKLKCFIASCPQIYKVRYGRQFPVENYSQEIVPAYHWHFCPFEMQFWIIIQFIPITKMHTFCLTFNKTETVIYFPSVDIIYALLQLHFYGVDISGSVTYRKTIYAQIYIYRLTELYWNFIYLNTEQIDWQHTSLWLSFLNLGSDRIDSMRT